MIEKINLKNQKKEEPQKEGIFFITSRRNKKIT